MARFVFALVAVLCMTVAVQAENIRGVVKSVDGKMSVTLMVNNMERTLELAPNVRVFSTFMQGRLRRRPVTMELNNGISSMQPNSQILCTTETRDGREVVTQIRLEGIVRTTTLR